LTVNFDLRVECDLRVEVDLGVEVDLVVDFELRVRVDLRVGFDLLTEPVLESHLGRNRTLVWKSFETKLRLNIKVELGPIDYSLTWKSIWA